MCAEMTSSETSGSSANTMNNYDTLFERYTANDDEREQNGSMNAFVSQQQSQLCNSAEALLKELSALKDPSLLSQYKEQANEIQQSCFQLFNFARKHYLTQTLDTRLVALLSDVNQTIQSLETPSYEETKPLSQQQTQFERFTSKYWVNDGSLDQVILSCTCQAPLLIFGKRDSLVSTQLKNNAETVWDSPLATQITSVYFDSPDLLLYKRRVAREEGAKLVRVRWYGKEQPQGDDLVYLELKSHHESWVMEQSIKRRIVLRECDVNALLARNDDDVKWTKTFAQNLARAANPSLNGKALDESVELLWEIRGLICKHDLRPCVRTSYLRMAFQSGEGPNKLRLTIDKDICMSDESHAPLGQWYAPDSITITRVPNAILEVKSSNSDSPAPCVQDLIDTDAIQDAHKFSKYQTGAIQLHSGKVKDLPYWASLPVFDKLFHLNNKTNQERRDSSSSNGSKRRSSLLRSSFMSSPSLRKRSVVLLPTTEQDVVKVKRVRVEPKTYFANERTYIQWVSVALLLVTIATLLLGIAIQDNLRAPRIMAIVLVFAALFIAGYSFAVYYRRLYLLKNAKPYGYIDHAGPMILSAAVIMAMLAILYYSFTADSTSTESAGSYQYASHDPVGGCQRHNFTGISLLEYQPSDSVLDETTNFLIIPSQSRITGLPLDYQGETVPISIMCEVAGTDIEAITYVRNVLFAVSESRGSSLLMAFQPRRVGIRTYFDLVSQWKLEGRSLSEGLAFIPDESGGKLFISEGATVATQDANVYVYDIPSARSSNETTFDDDVEAIYPSYHLNGKILTAGISDAPKMGSLTFFEGILYVLYDNARRVRGWNLDTGAMVVEWILPRVDGGSHQWEGMTLQRLSSEDGASSSSSVLLHMTLDSPAEVWTFRLEETGESSYVLPACAAAY